MSIRGKTFKHPFDEDSDEGTSRMTGFKSRFLNFGLKKLLLGANDGELKSKIVGAKVLFSAERTFLSWFTSAVFLCGFGISVVNGNSSLKGRIGGGLLTGVGVMLILYALATFVNRTRSLLNGDKGGYFDFNGPILLSFVSIGAFAVAIAFAI